MKENHHQGILYGFILGGLSFLADPFQPKNFLRSPTLTHTTHVGTCSGNVGIFFTKFWGENRATIRFVLRRTREAIACRARVHVLARAFARLDIEAPMSTAIRIVARAKPVFAFSPRTRGTGGAMGKGRSYVVSGEVVANQERLPGSGTISF